MRKQKCDFEETDLVLRKQKCNFEETALVLRKQKCDFEETDLVLRKEKCDFEETDLVHWERGERHREKLVHTFVTERPARSRLDDVSNIIETPSEERKDDAADDSLFTFDTTQCTTLHNAMIPNLSLLVNM